MLGRYVTFSDESHMGHGHQYMVIGGVLCKSNCASAFRRKIERAQGTFPDALKWERIRKANFVRYLNLVTDFFEWNCEQHLDFCALVIDTHKLDHATYNQDDSEIGFNKLLAQHLTRHSRAMGPMATFKCYYAHRDSRYNLETVGAIVNNMAAIHHGSYQRRYVEVKYRPFRDEKMFFMADILIGAIGAAYNGTLGTGSKRDVAEHIRISACLNTLAAPTPGRYKHFDIWELELK